MTLLFAIHSAVTWALVGLIWTVQCVHYPLFAQVGPETFRGYHARHMWQVTLLVGPLVLLEAITAVLLVMKGAHNLWLMASFVPMVFNWFSTSLAQVPVHARLAKGYDPKLLRRLIANNWWRTAAGSLRGVCLLMVVS